MLGFLKKVFTSISGRYRTSKMSGVQYARYKGVEVGPDCRVLTRLFGSEPWLIKIGRKVTVAPGVQFLTHDGSTWLFSDEKGRRQLYRRIEIGDEVFVGAGSIVMPGVKINSNVIVAAGSVVVKSVPSGTIIGGNPAKIIGDYYDYKERVLANYISNSDIDLNEDKRTRTAKALDKTFKDFMK